MTVQDKLNYLIEGKLAKFDTEYMNYFVQSGYNVVLDVRDYKTCVAYATSSSNNGARFLGNKTTSFDDNIDLLADIKSTDEVAFDISNVNYIKIRGLSSAYSGSGRYKLLVN